MAEAGSGSGLDHTEPRVVLGMPVYNQTALLRLALDSLLAQTYPNFRLIAVDDSTSDEPGRILREYMARDPRIAYHRNERRLFMIENWVRAFTIAGGEVDYFAWVSDHDVWDADWLATLVEALNSAPHVVLAYPITRMVFPTGQIVERKSFHFATESMPAGQRARAVCWKGGRFGEMVYGLFRANALHRAGIYRKVVYPDVLLITELALQGGVRQILTPLWSRRRFEVPTIARQRRTLFTHVPWYAYFPVSLVHAGTLLWNHVLGHRAGGFAKRWLGARLVYHFCASRLHRQVQTRSEDLRAFFWNLGKGSSPLRPVRECARKWLRRPETRVPPTSTNAALPESPTLRQREVA